jgi:hypothetical protein
VLLLLLLLHCLQVKSGATTASRGMPAPSAVRAQRRLPAVLLPAWRLIRGWCAPATCS